MGRIKKYFRSLRSFDYVLFAFFLISCGLTAWLYRGSVVRAVYSVRDLGLSVAYYFCCLFKYDDAITPTVTTFPDINVLRYLPYDFDEILRRLKDMWKVIFDKECFLSFLKKVSTFINDASVIIMLLLPVVLIFWFVGKSIMLTPNKDKHGDQTKPMRWFEGKPLEIILFVRAWLVELYHTFRKKKQYFYSITLIWLLNFNILTIVLGIFAYYFYFAVSFDFVNLVSIQICKLILDLMIMFLSAPWFFWVIVGYIVLCLVRTHVGFTRLSGFETRNRDFISSQPICVLVCGLMGSKKTTMITDISLSKEVMFREKALELMMEQDSKFPNFPWIHFEDELREAFRHHRIYSLTTARDWVRRREQRFLRFPSSDNVFGYNLDRYRYEFNNKLRIESLWDVLENYAQLYLVYTIESSLILANYSIRTDNVLVDKGNFPIWSSDFFRRTPEESFSKSRFCHILDYDLLRLGKQMLQDNPNRGSFEFGCVTITEVGKERGNMLTLQELKKKVDECNQKNDLFNYALKMIRHKATICGFCFACVIADEQRAESLGADARDLYSVVHIRESSPFRLVMPCFDVEEIVHGFLHPGLLNFNVEYKANRGDFCLSFALIHNVRSSLHNFYQNTYNLFGVSELKCELEAGNLDGNFTSASYYISSKKDYADRFSTDCHRQHFEVMLKNALVGLDDYPEYEKVIASAFEFKKQNSYFINDMENVTAA